MGEAGTFSPQQQAALPGCVRRGGPARCQPTPLLHPKSLIGHIKACALSPVCLCILFWSLLYYRICFPQRPGTSPSGSLPGVGSPLSIMNDMPSSTGPKVHTGARTCLHVCPRSLTTLECLFNKTTHYPETKELLLSRLGQGDRCARPVEPRLFCFQVFRFLCICRSLPMEGATQLVHQ